MYLLGQGTEPDALRAYAWMRASAESGDLQFKQAADKLLANTLIENYQVELK